ncbi:MAG: hypothetical protein HY924_12575 [Elusimicrobia bacterium]|nr:hypothetical protein [Elusimicrobiota bacterium]
MSEPARPGIWTWAVLGGASLWILACSPAQYLGRQHDDILFVIAAQALSYGDYALFTSPGSPPLVNVLPGLPLLLQPVVWLAGDWTPAYQIFSALLMAACPWAAWLWLRRRLDPAAALLAASVFATSPWVLSQAGTVMPEAPYTLLTALLLLALERPGTPGAPWLLLLLSQVRPAGLSLLPAAAARLLARKRLREAVLTLAPALAGLLLWSAWRWRAGQGYGAAHPFPVALADILFYLSAWGGCFLPEAWAGGKLALLLGLGLAGLAAAGLARAWRRSPWEPAAVMLVCAVLMHALWGGRHERHLIPLLPWLLWAAAEASGRRASVCLAILLACQLGFHATRRLGGSAWSKPELAATYSWLRSSRGPADILASPLYVRDGFYASRPSVPLPDAASSEELARLLSGRKVKLVLWQDSLDLPGAARLSDRGLFKPVYENEAEQARVYEVLPVR